MNRKLRIPLVVLVVTGIIFLSGPRIDTRYRIQPVDISGDPQNYVDISESRFSDIRPGTEKKIIWADSTSHESTPYSIVYLHGFSASRQEVAPLCDMLAAELSANLFYTRLSGHGRNSSAMKTITVDRLLNDANEALEIGKSIGKKIILIGSSTGGTLATWLGTQQQDDRVAAIILLSPNYGLRRSESEILYYPWGKNIFSLIQGEEYHFSPVNALQEKYWTTEYPSEALLGMFGLIEIIRQSPVENIRIPTLMLYSEQDEIISINQVKQQFNKISSSTKKLVAIADSKDPQKHILAGKVLSQATTLEVLLIIKQFLAPLIDR